MRGIRGLAVLFMLAAVWLGSAASSAHAAAAWYELGSGENQFTLFREFDLASYGGAPLMAWGGTNPATGGEAGLYTATFGGQPLAEHPWNDLTNSRAFSPSFPNWPSVAVVGGTLYVTAAVRDPNNGDKFQVRVAKLVGSTWQAVGGSLNIAATRDAIYPRIADIGGAPWVTWQEEAACAQIGHVKRWNGSVWVEQGSGANPLQNTGCDDVTLPQIASIGGQPYVAIVFRNQNAYHPPIVLVKRYDSGSNTWVTVGGGVSGPDEFSQGCADGSSQCTMVSSVSLAEVVAGVPYVAYTEGETSGRSDRPPDQVLVKRYNSSTNLWVTVGGGPANHDPNARGVIGCPTNCAIKSASLAGNANTPYVAWEEHDGTNYEARVAKLNGAGTAWDELGSGASPINLKDDLNGIEIRLRFIGGTPIVAFSEAYAQSNPDIYINTHVKAFGEGPTNTQRPVMSGPPKPGSQMHCTNGQWSPNPSGFKITWERAPHGTTDENDPSWNPINGAVGADYTAQADDIGSRVHCRVTAVGTTFVSDAPSNSRQVDNDEPKSTVKPQITGDPRTGHELTCNSGPWQNNPDLTYYWYRDGGFIFGTDPNSNKYTSHTPDDRDNLITCRVQGANDLGETTSPFSDPVHTVSATPEYKTKPKLTVSAGENPVGRKAHCTAGTWRRDYGEYTWEWSREGGRIAGATGPDYTTTIDDVGRAIYCIARSTNPHGTGLGAASNHVLIELPQGYGKGRMFKTGGRNEFDPVNLMALSDEYYDTLDDLIVPRLQKAAEKKIEECKKRSDVPNEVPVFEEKDFRVFLGTNGVSSKVLCPILLHAPESDIDFGRYGIQYRGEVKDTKTGKPQRCLTLNFCPDLGFKLTPVTPAQVGTLPPELAMRLGPISPERVLWDFDNDKKVDADCPAATPVVRTMFEKGHYHARAIIINKDSAETGLYWNAEKDFDHPEPNGRSGFLREAQAFACRTSLQPPPDPKQGPCVNAGTIGRAQIIGNFCPVYLRALDPNYLDDLEHQSSDVYKLLKKMAEQLAVDKPARRRLKAAGGIPVKPEDGFVTASKFNTGDGSDPFGDQGIFADKIEVAMAYYNSASAMTGFDEFPPTLGQILGFDVIDDVDKAVPGKAFDPKKANFALDQLYLARGKIKINGTTQEPNGDVDTHPTLIAPSDVKNAAEEGASAGEKLLKEMVINNTDVRTALGETGQLTLAAKGAIKAKLDDAKSQAEAVLRENINLNGLKDLDVLGPLKIRGTEAKVELNNDGTATLTAMAELPFLTDPSTGEKLRVKVTLKADLRGNVTLEGVHVHAPLAALGVLTLRKVDVDYKDGLTVKGEIVFPPTNEGIRVNNFRVNKDGDFLGLSVDYLAGAGSGIPIASPFPLYLTSLGGGVDLGPPATFDLGATFSVGPSTGGGCPTVGLDSRARIEIGGRPTVVGRVNGNVKLTCIPLGNIQFYADSTGLVTLIGQFGFDGGPFYVSGGLNAGINWPNWQVEVHGKGGLHDVEFLDDIAMDVVLSNIGFAGCGGFKTFLGHVRGGAAVKFIDGRPPFTTLELIHNLKLFTGCDLSKYKTVVRRATVREAAVNGTSFDISKSGRGVFLSLEGAGAAPHVRLKSPSGKVLDFANATKGVQMPNAWGQILEKEDRTVVILAHPETGTWTATTDAGTPAVNRIQQADVLPAPEVSGRVSGKGASRTLTYSVPKQEGQVVRFVESAKGSLKTIKTVKGGGKGKVRYLTGEAKGTRRTLLAQVSQDKLPRDNLTIAKYTAPNPKVGRPGHVRIKRKGKGAIVTWKRATLAKAYAISVTDTQGGRTAYYAPKGKTKVKIGRVPSSVGLQVRVVAVSQSGRNGAPGKGRLRAKHKKHKKKHGHH